MKNPLKILILGAGLEATYLVLGPGVTIRSILTSANAARLLKKEAMDLIVSPQFLATGALDREFIEDQAA